MDQFSDIKIKFNNIAESKYLWEKKNKDETRKEAIKMLFTLFCIKHQERRCLKYFQEDI
jgi:hypothetical protein